MSIVEPLVKGYLAHDLSSLFNSSPAFFESWWETLALKFPPLARQGQMAVFKKKAFKNLVHFKVMRIAGWNNEYYQDFTEDRFEEFLILSRQHPWDYFEIYINSAYTQPERFERFQTLGFPVLQLESIPALVIDISQGWDAYWAGKSRKYRQGLLNKLKGITALSPELVFYTGPDGVDDFFEQFIPLHLAYWDERAEGSYFHDRQETAFIKTWAKKLQSLGQLQLTGLLIDGQVANLRMNVIAGKTLYCILTVNTGYRLDLHPGFISTHLMIKEACHLGLEKIDMGPGTTDYKKKVSTSIEQGYRMLVINPRSLAGQFVRYWKSRSDGQLKQV